MARTFQQVCNRARIPLNDADKVRYPDADLLAYANDAVLVLRTRRPDLFIGSWGTIAEAVLSDNIPFEDQLFVPICDYVTARAEFRDDEDAMQQRAQAFFDLFGSLTS